jgi:excisionase family DNA binding protein
MDQSPTLFCGAVNAHHPATERDSSDTRTPVGSPCPVPALSSSTPKLPLDGPLLLTEREAAKRLSISPRKLWELRNAGEIRCVKIGRSVRYCVNDLAAWIDSKRSSTT